jgi:hypothetical protein
LLLLAKNLTLLGRPNFQLPLFRIQWNLSSILRARAVKPVNFTVSKLSRTKPREINTSKINDFNPPEMNTCRKIRTGNGCLSVFSLEHAPHLNAVITSEQFPAQPPRRGGVRARDLRFCGLVEIATRRLSYVNSRKINTSKINDFNPPEMNTCEKREVGHLLAFAILLGWTSLRTSGGIA